MKKTHSRVSNSDRASNSMDNRTSNEGSSMSNNWSISISCNSIIGDISNISIISIGIVAHMLSTTIRKSNRVRSSYTASTISRLSSIKTRTRIVIIDSIGVGVGVRLISIDRGSMGNHRGGNKRGMSYSMNNGMTNSTHTSKDWSMSNNTSSTMKTVGRVSYSSNTSSKSLGLSGASVFSLERFRN